MAITIPTDLDINMSPYWIGLSLSKGVSNTITTEKALYGTLETADGYRLWLNKIRVDSYTTLKEQTVYLNIVLSVDINDIISTIQSMSTPIEITSIEINADYQDYTHTYAYTNPSQPITIYAGNSGGIVIDTTNEFIDFLTEMIIETQITIT